MLFSVIYSVDVPEDEDISRFAPPQAEDLWYKTEEDESYEYGYLEGQWENGSHRKWVVMLDREQFDEFVETCDLFAEHCETMGSIGAPDSAMAGLLRLASTPIIPTLFNRPMSRRFQKSRRKTAMSRIGSVFVVPY